MIAAIESASSEPSVALVEEDGSEISIDGWTTDRRRGEEILPRLMEMLDARGLQLARLTAVGVGIGPGSFTGLRVGLGLGKGLAFGLAIPIVGVPSLAAWLEAETDAVAALARAGARDAFVLVRGSEAPEVVDRDDLPSALREAPIVAPREMAEAFGLSRARSPMTAAAAVGRMTARRLAGDPGGDDLRDLEPAYLRGPRGLGPAETRRALTWP